MSDDNKSHLPGSEEDSSGTNVSVLLLPTDEGNIRAIRNRETVWECETCADQFKKEYDMLIHMTIHVPERNFKCDLCGIDFSKISAMSQHRDSKDRRHVCQACEKGLEMRFCLTLKAFYNQIQTGENSPHKKGGVRSQMSTDKEDNVPAFCSTQDKKPNQADEEDPKVLQMVLKVEP